jgi:agmatinase
MMTPDEFDPDSPAMGDGLFGLATPVASARVVVMPVPWEATTSYRRGTRRGPERLIAASAQVDLTDLDAGPAWKSGIALLPPDPRIAAWCDEAAPDALAVIEAGGGRPEESARVDRLSEKVNALVKETVRGILDRGAIPALIGGDHSIPFGGIEAAAETVGPIGILHIDAHADLRVAYEGFTWSHASIMHNVLERIPGVSRLVQVGIRDVGERELARIEAEPERIRTWFDGRIARRLAEGEPWIAIVREIVAALSDRIWVSLDVDGLDPSFCPATGTPVPGGLSFRDLVVLLGEVADARRIVGFDINEIGDAEWDGAVAARLLYKLAGWAARVE